MAPSIEKWLGDVVRQEKPPPDIVAWNVGLFETERGYTAYLCGSRHYSEQDDDWACDEDFTPEERYCELNELKDRRWQDVLESVVASVRRFLESPIGADSFLARARAVTVGFDEGDLVAVKTT